jgi:hypothetical protein
MKIEQIVDQALAAGYFTPTMEVQLSRLCEGGAQLTETDYLALDRLMGAILTEQVTTFTRKQFINVMEDLVLTETMARTTHIEATSNISLDLSDIVAFALNRLPPLYATTQEGANYQRMRAQEEMLGLIQQKVDEGIQRFLATPDFYPERVAISQTTGKEVLEQMSTLLQSYATSFSSDGAVPAEQLVAA